MIGAVSWIGYHIGQWHTDHRRTGQWPTREILCFVVYWLAYFGFGAEIVIYGNAHQWPEMTLSIAFVGVVFVAIPVGVMLEVFATRAHLDE